MFAPLVAHSIIGEVAPQPVPVYDLPKRDCPWGKLQNREWFEVEKVAFVRESSGVQLFTVRPIRKAGAETIPPAVGRSRAKRCHKTYSIAARFAVEFSNGKLTGTCIDSLVKSLDEQGLQEAIEDSVNKIATETKLICSIGLESETYLRLMAVAEKLSMSMSSTVNAAVYAYEATKGHADATA